MKILFAGIVTLFVTSTGAIVDAGETKAPSGTPLSPARSLIGTWETPFYTKFRTKMDSSRFIFEDVATEMRKITWVVTKGMDENTVNIYQTHKSKAFITLDPNIIIAPDPGDSPYLYGKISSTRLIVKNFSGERCGTFYFTTDQMEGTWDHRTKVGMYLLDRFYTKKNALMLAKRR